MFVKGIEYVADKYGPVAAIGVVLAFSLWRLLKRMETFFENAIQTARADAQEARAQREEERKAYMNANSAMMAVNTELARSVQAISDRLSEAGLKLSKGAESSTRRRTR